MDMADMDMLDMVDMDMLDMADMDMLDMVDMDLSQMVQYWVRHDKCPFKYYSSKASLVVRKSGNGVKPIASWYHK